MAKGGRTDEGSRMDPQVPASAGAGGGPGVGVARRRGQLAEGLIEEWSVGPGGPPDPATSPPRPGPGASVERRGISYGSPRRLADLPDGGFAPPRAAGRLPTVKPTATRPALGPAPIERGLIRASSLGGNRRYEEAVVVSCPSPRRGSGDWARPPRT